ncbi:MAG TPA: SDR family oxidoreductase [Chthoniobacter sp.]|nr:SDR family oxidoreductase [Chthoniobacter sp.]
MRIVITGTSSGIGRHLAEKLSGAGHEVWGLARSSQNAGFATSACDVSLWSEVENAQTQIAAKWPHVDVVICGAAIQGAIGPAMEVDPQVWSGTVRVDLDGTYFVLRAFWELLRRSPRRAKVICFSGGGATKARPNFSAYAAAKTGVVRLVETLAVEWTGLSVDINAIAPGAINTAMTRETVSRGPELSGRGEFEAAQRQLAEGGQSIEKVWALVEFLLSEKSDGITGRLLSAQWDDWATLPAHAPRLAESEIYQLRRILPEERGAKF